MYTTYRNGPTASNARTHTRRYTFVRSGRGGKGECIAGKLREALQCFPPFFFSKRPILAAAAKKIRRRRRGGKGAASVCVALRDVCVRAAAANGGGGGRFTTLPRR